MKFIEIEPLAEPKELIGKKVPEDHPCFQEVEPGTTITVNGTPIIIYDRFAENLEDIRIFLKHIKYSKNQRLNQYLGNFEINKTMDILFGHNPDNPVFSTAAAPCKFNFAYPQWYQRLIQLGEKMGDLYKTADATKWLGQMDFLEKQVNPRWRMGNSPYTQGVINSANALGYHFDRDNVPNGWSAMIYFMEHISGGNLVIPSLKLKFLCRDMTYMLFDGQSVIHGVTPIKKNTFRGYRYSIVYYARKSMVGLGTYEEELAKAKQVEMNKHKGRMEKLEK